MDIKTIKKGDKIRVDLEIFFLSPEVLKKAEKTRNGTWALTADISAKLRKRGFKADPLEAVLFETADSAQAFVGTAAADSAAFEAINYYRRLGALITEISGKMNASSVKLNADIDLEDERNIRALLEGINLCSYDFTRYKSKADKPKDGLKKLFITSRAESSQLKRIAEQVAIACDAVKFARDLVNMPAQDCTPAFFVKQGKESAAEFGLKVEVLDREKLRRLGAHALLSVSRGSSEPPYLLKVRYQPRRAKKVVALIGKGITFDSGGLSIKPGNSMESMKCDMSGAATVLATLRAASALGLHVEIHGYMPLTENMINGQATRPGDIVRSMSGKTIEILNTDAEGRLILADAITLAQREKCDVMIDLATLTGACMVALGTDYAGLFANDDEVAKALVDAGAMEGERFWRLPLAPEYRDLIKSPLADIKNIGGPYGGAITAALFLQEFVDKTPWAHLDIAGPAFVNEGKAHIKKGGVGFGVLTLLRYLKGLE